MNKILFKTLDNGKDLYKPEKATLGSDGFALGHPMGMAWSLTK